MSVKVYTWKPEFMLFGAKGQFVATSINEYERVDIGCGYFGLVFQNPHTSRWHVALEGCGALVQSAKTKKGVISKVRKDVETGDPKLMKKQMAQGRKDRAKAWIMTPNDFFAGFRKEETK